MTDFCTYFDHRYLPRGLALYRSLKRHRPDARLWVLCLDEACQAALTAMALPDVRLIPLGVLEATDPALAAAKATRSAIEYYFTCTPALTLHVLEANPDVAMLTYLDADMYFFADPAPLFDALADASIGIIAHRYPPSLAHLAQYGIYNVGWVTFRRDEHGIACLSWWREQCIEWCYDRLEANRYGDQKYLDDWPTRFPGVAVLPQKGANLAPWNVGGYTLARRDGGVLVDGESLIFFHFHGFKELLPGLYDPHLATYGVTLTGLLREAIYVPYVVELRAILAARQTEGGQEGLARSIRGRQGAPKGGLQALLERAKLWRRVLLGRLTGRFLDFRGVRP